MSPHVRHLQEQQAAKQKAKGELDTMLADNEPEPISDDEIGSKSRELRKRLNDTLDSVETQGHPATHSDFATLRDVLDFLSTLVDNYGADDTAEGRQERREQRVKAWLRS
jgi:hypothetical protein